jgi:hypothetical protein
MCKPAVVEPFASEAAIDYRCEEKKKKGSRCEIIGAIR